ncbi:MAG: CsbD family protein [Nitrococcus sp.]|nr:CsbD family protein [Nitrococcus sp.]
MKDPKTDKAEGTADRVFGKIKEMFARMFGEKEREAEGRRQQGRGHLHETKGEAKDKFKEF